MLQHTRATLAAVMIATALVPVGAPAASASPASICTSSRPKLAQRLSNDIQAAVKSRRGTISVSVYDRRTGTRCDLRSTRHYQTASIVKVSILSALLRERGAKGLTAGEKRLATAMITKSDNDAATALWNATGRSAFTRFLSAAGMRHTTVDATGYWGKTHTTSADQIALLKLLTARNTVLTSGARSYVLGLMTKVVAGQRWGTPAGAPSGSTVHVKNGWVDRGDSARWRINSLGTFSGHGRDSMIAVLTEGNADQAYAHASIEAVARKIHRDLG